MQELIPIDTIRISISILSLTFGYWQYRQKRNTEKLIALEAIELHKNIAVALGATQKAKDAIISGNNPNFEIGRSEGLCQAVLHESAKLYCNLKN